ncbi:MAG: EamA family transporter [Dermatophilaceae bacterium]
MSTALRRRPGRGLLALLISSAAFGTAGPFAKALIETGWSPGAVVLLRVVGAATLLLPAAAWSVRGRWAELLGAAPIAAAYGALGVAAAQFGYFQAVARLEVGVALLIEYLGIVVVVLWVWASTRRRPGRVTLAGIATAITGLVLVLDVAGSAGSDVVGVAWGLVAAVGLAGHYVLAARDTQMPPLAFATIGLASGGAVLGIAGGVGLVPLTAGSGPVAVGSATAPAWVALAELVVVAAAVAYVLGVLGARHLGSTVASFVGLTEVLFAVCVAWLVLGEVPGPVQVVGGLVLLVGVAVVRLGDTRGAAPASSPAAVGDRPVSAGPVFTDPR